MSTVPINAATSTPWATEAQWQTHREVITRLYLRERKKVKEIMEIMEERHGFRAK